MPKFLVDGNLSPYLAQHLRELKYDALAIRETGLKGKADEKIIEWAQENKRIVITSDLDFGEFFWK